MSLRIIPPGNERVGMFIYQFPSVIGEDYLWGVNSPNLREEWNSLALKKVFRWRLHILAVGNHIVCTE